MIHPTEVHFNPFFFSLSLRLLCKIFLELWSRVLHNLCWGMQVQRGSFVEDECAVSRSERGLAASVTQVWLSSVGGTWAFFSPQSLPPEFNVADYFPFFHERFGFLFIFSSEHIHLTPRWWSVRRVISLFILTITVYSAALLCFAALHRRNNSYSARLVPQQLKLG